VRINKHEHILPVFAFGAYCDIVQLMAEFIPLPVLEKVDVAGIRWDVHLPTHAHADEIGAEVQSIGRIARMAGFEEVRIGSFAGGVDRIVPGISGRTPNGEAIASTGGAKVKGQRYQTSRDPVISSGVPWKDKPPEQFTDIITPSYVTGTMLVNTEAIAQKLSEKRNGALHSSKAWAEELNREIGAASRLAAQKNLLSKTGLAVFAGAELYAAHQSSDYIHFKEIYLSSFATQSALAAVAIYGIGAVYKRIRGEDSKTRYSLIAGAQLDRMAYVYGATAMKRLVKPI
jgi:hypothetical protein